MRWLAASTAALALFAQGAAADTFRFTAIPDEDQSRLVERFSKVANYLEERLDVEVEYVPVKSYGATVTAFRNNQVQLAWFGGLSGVQARRLVPGSTALAQGSEDAEFKSYIIAHRSTGLERSEELPAAIEGMSLTFGSRTSTSGRLMPEHFLRERFGEAPDTLFSRVGYSGDHSRTIALVEAGTWDLGAVNYSVWEAAVADDRVDTDKVEVVWATRPTRITTGPCVATSTSSSARASPKRSARPCWRWTTPNCWRAFPARPSSPPTTPSTPPSRTSRKSSACCADGG